MAGSSRCIKKPDLLNFIFIRMEILCMTTYEQHDMYSKYRSSSFQTHGIKKFMQWERTMHGLI